jgi:hypothetical protein
MSTEGVAVGSFAYELGDLECKPYDLPDFEQRWQSVSNGGDFTTMGCGTFRKMSGPVEQYVIATIKRTLADRDLAARDVDRIVFATTDANLALAGRDFVATVLDAAGLVSCVPVMVSFQQCCASVTALSYGWSMFHDPAVRNVLVVAFDLTASDSDRIRSFALFGDGAASCLISRDGAPGLRLVGSEVRVDYDGLRGRDSMVSRQTIARDTLDSVLGSTRMDEVAMVFPTNLYLPLTSFNAMVTGIHKSKLHFAEMLYSAGHCGNCDWMLNLIGYRDKVGLREGGAYLSHASAPGFFAWALLVGT